MKPDTLLCRKVQKIFQYLDLFRRGARVWRTDRQTDWQTERY